MRHFVQGLHVVLNHNLIGGGIRHESLFPHRMCKCDGQYSENKRCRMDTSPRFSWISSVQRDLGSCQAHADYNILYRPVMVNLDHDVAPTNLLNPKLFPCQPPDNDDRPVLVILSYGFHTQTNAAVTAKRFLEPVLSNPFFSPQCRRSVILFDSLGVVDRAVEKIFPHEARELTQVFNREIQAYLMEHHKNVTFLPHWNLTEDAQSSDGVHYLLDVNMQKVYNVLNLLEAMQKEG